MCSSAAVVGHVSLRVRLRLLSFRVFGLVSVSFAFRFRACVLSVVEILSTSKEGGGEEVGLDSLAFFNTG